MHSTNLAVPTPADLKSLLIIQFSRRYQVLVCFSIESNARQEEDLQYLSTLLWIVSSWPTLKCHFTSYSCFSHHLFLKFSPVFHSCLYVIHFLLFEFKIYDSNVCHFHFCHLLSKFRLSKVCHYLHKFKKSHKTHKTKWKSIMTSTPSGYREKK